MSSKLKSQNPKKVENSENESVNLMTRTSGDPISPNLLDESDDEDVNQGTDRLGDSLEQEDTDSAMDEEEEEEGGTNSLQTVFKNDNECRKQNLSLDISGPESEEEDDESGTKDPANKISLFITTGIKSKVEDSLNSFTPRWKNWLIRGLSGLSLISGFSLLIWIGPEGLVFLTFLVVTSAYSEVLTLGLKVTRPKNKNISKLCWSFFFTTQYFFYFGHIWSHLATSPLQLVTFPSSDKFLFLVDFLADKHLVVSFSLYLANLMWFVLSLDTNYIRSYSMLAWSHMLLFFFVVPGYLMNQTLLNGMIWYVLPMTLITLNDIAAYYVGFFFGKTPLIKLSPKKTREGFLGGGIITVIFGTFLSYFLMNSHLTSPIKVNSLVEIFSRDEFSKNSFFEIDVISAQSEIFQLQTYQMFGLSFELYPFLLHAFVISILCSTVGPFGGFLASGFKRGCKRKNFGGFIPGHGGVTDRCDCMFLCAVITNIYYKSFVE